MTFLIKSSQDSIQIYQIMTLSDKPSSLSPKKQSQADFFDHYKQFTTLIDNIDKILSGATSKSLEGNEIRSSVILLDQITRDLQWVGSSWHADPLEQEEHGQEILRRWKAIKELNQTKITPKFRDVYEALSEIFSLDKKIAKRGIISLDTSIFHARKKEGGITPQGLWGSIESVETAPKYTLFCDVFQNRVLPDEERLSLQDCMIYEERLEWEGRMRATPYKIIYIPAPIMQTWCISDQIGQAIYIYEWHPLLETIISGMKWGTGEMISQSLIWKRDSKKMKEDISDVLENGIQWKIEKIPTEDMKLRLWAQKALMEARVFLDSIGMEYLWDGKWDLREMKSRQAWKSAIWGKRLWSFPSAVWNKAQGIGNKKGQLLSPTHVASMLISIGYRREDIVEKISDSLEWENKIDVGAYQKLAKEELEKEEHKKFLDSIGMKYLWNGKWYLEQMKNNQTWINPIWGKRLTNFPSTRRNKKWGIGNNEGKLQNQTHIANMLVSIGYKRGDIVEKVSNLLEWEDCKNADEYKKLAQTELEKEEYRNFLNSIGMEYLWNGKWDLEKMKGYGTWKNAIWGKKLWSFPSSTWNKAQGIGNDCGQLIKSTHIANMLVSIGYKWEDIICKKQIS